MKCFNVCVSNDSVIGLVADVCRTPSFSMYILVLVPANVLILVLSTLFLGLMSIHTACGCLLPRYALDSPVTLALSRL